MLLCAPALASMGHPGDCHPIMSCGGVESCYPWGVAGGTSRPRGAQQVLGHASVSCAST